MQQRSSGWASAQAGTLLAAALLMGGCGKTVAVVTSAQAQMKPITRVVSTNGKVELTHDFQAHAVGAGQVKEVLVHIGQQVQAGQELIRLQDADALLRVSNASFSLAAAQNGFSNLRNGGSADEVLGAKADMTAAQVTLQQATSRLGNLQQAQAIGAASANEVSAAQVQVTEARNRINALQARQTGRFSKGDVSVQRDQMARSRAELAAAQSDLTNTNIRAPFPGTVYAIGTVQYANVNPGQELVKVAEMSRIQVRAFFDEPEVGRLAVDQPVRIVWEAKPGRVWNGHVALLPTSITTYGTRNVGECVIAVDDAHGDLIPNVSVTVTVSTLHKDSALTVPHESLRTDGTNSYVYRIVEDKLKRTPVKVGVVTMTDAEITDGLQPGDLVMRSPLSDVELNDGLAVKVQH